MLRQVLGTVINQWLEDPLEGPLLEGSTSYFFINSSRQCSLASWLPVFLFTGLSDRSLCPKSPPLIPLHQQSQNLGSIAVRRAVADEISHLLL